MPSCFRIRAWRVFRTPVHGRSFCIAFFALALLFVSALRGEAETSSADLYSALASHDYENMRKAVEKLAASDDPRAVPILSALQAGRLFADTDGELFIRNPDGSLEGAVSGQRIAGELGKNLREIRINNTIRRALEGALGRLRLFAPDPNVRAAAANAIFQTRDESALIPLERALARERVAKVRRAMQEAKAALLLFSPGTPPKTKLEAIALLRNRGDQEVAALLSELNGQPPEVMAAAKDAVVAIERQQQIWNFLQIIFYGFSLGSILLLAATGLAITFGVMGVINMAHGEMVMLGAYTTFVVQQATLRFAPEWLPASPILALPFAFLVTGLLGVLIERGLIRFLYGRPLETLLATWGLSLVLQQAVRTLFGASNREVMTPSWMSGAVPLGAMTITANRLTIIAFSVVVFGSLILLLRTTFFGLQMRAVTQNRAMAAAMGIRTPRVDALTFGLGSAVAGLAGVALSQIDNVSPNLGQNYIIDSFMVVVFGGVGNLWGTALGALTLGIVNKFLEPVAGAVLGKIVVLCLLIVFIQRRPRGLFPLKGRAAEA
ncbi:MAG: urea ABC transporter permease subunit UrtB [Acidobacteriia bacterium]|nr:urea ABC transporter permease subunit UrtB [Methyloceanibacter sp.]MCL6492060.1 urea ABC transporter permease subunit UrtB [Terriglobia bacterium]